MPENTNAHCPSHPFLLLYRFQQSKYPLPNVFMTDPIVRLDRLLLCPSTGFTGVSMLGDPVFLRNRSRFGLHKLRPPGETPTPLPLAPKRVNANSNPKRRDHANLDSPASLLMAGACERRARH